MRWIFLAVFSLNLVYIAWQISVPDDEVYADIRPLKKSKPIVLLSEVKQAKAIEKAEELATASTEKEVAEISEEASSADVQKVTEVIEAEVANADKSKAESVSTAAAAEALKEPAKAEVAPAEPVTEIVSEMVSETASAETISVKEGLATSCFTLGPFRDLDKLRGFTREIMPYVTETDFRGREESEQSLYWVYVDPEKSRKKAVATGKRLKAKKIKDFYLIREGEKLHGLSLGHFRNKDGAYGLAKKVRKLGFNVTVEPVFKIYTIYWLDYKLASDADIPQSIFDKHIKPSKKDNITRISRDCDI